MEKTALTRISIAVLAMASGAAAFVVYFGPAAPSPPSSVLAAHSGLITGQPTSPTEMTDVKTSTVPPASVAATSPSSRLQNELMASKDWRQFAYSAMKRPEEGGYFYAKYAALKCTVPMRREWSEDFIQKTIARTGTVSLAQLAKQQELDSVCASFTHREAMRLFAELKGKESDGRDPYVNAAKRVDDVRFGRAPLTELKSVTEALLNTDGMVQAGLLANVAYLDSEARKVGGMYFDGQVYPAGDASAQLTLAMNLAVCSEDAPCPNDDFRNMLCVMKGQCFANRHEFVNAVLGFTDSQIADLLALETKVREAIAAHDVGAFVR